MAHRLIRRVLAQEVRFPDPLSAERYADRFGGGLVNWGIAVAGASEAEPSPVASHSGRG